MLTWVVVVVVFDLNIFLTLECGFVEVAIIVVAAVHIDIVLEAVIVVGAEYIDVVEGISAVGMFAAEMFAALKFAVGMFVIG